MACKFPRNPELVESIKRPIRPLTKVVDQGIIDVNDNENRVEDVEKVDCRNLCKVS